MILALDLGTTTGWAFGMNGHPVDFGEFACRGKHDSLAQVYSTFLVRVRELIVPHNPDLIVYERVRRHLSTLSAQRFGGFEAAMLVEAFRKTCPVREVGTTTLKKASTGKGNAPKMLMIEAATAWLIGGGGTPGDLTDNEADALCLLKYAMEMFV